MFFKKRWNLRSFMKDKVLPSYCPRCSCFRIFLSPEKFLPLMFFLRSYADLAKTTYPATPKPSICLFVTHATLPILFAYRLYKKSALENVYQKHQNYKSGNYVKVIKIKKVSYFFFETALGLLLTYRSNIGRFT